MKRKTDVTISIVSYNTHEYLKKCLESIYRHTKNITYEIIVVDNASTDGTQKMVERLFPKVTLIKNRKNNFYGGANNQALQKAQGRYTVILNADTYFKNNSLAKLVYYMDKHPQVGAVEGLEIYEDGRLVPNGSRFTTPLLDFYELSFIGKHFKDHKKIHTFRLSRKGRRETFSIDVGCDAYLGVRTELFKRIHGYDPKLLLYYTENDLCLRIKNEGYDVVHLGDSYVIHKVSVSANKLKWKKLDLYYSDLRYYYVKNGYRLFGTLLYIDLKIEQLLLRIFRPNMFA